MFSFADWWFLSLNLFQISSSLPKPKLAASAPCYYSLAIWKEHFFISSHTQWGLCREGEEEGSGTEVEIFLLADTMVRWLHSLGLGAIWTDSLCYFAWDIWRFLCGVPLILPSLTWAMISPWPGHFRFFLSSFSWWYLRLPPAGIPLPWQVTLSSRVPFINVFRPTF